MNTVPFELLSASEDSYRPLVAEFTVTASPSLVFVQYAERERYAGAGASLMALADPKYGKPKSLAAATTEEVQAATRGSKFLSYFEPLPETRSEVEAIAKAFGGEMTNLLLGENAIESKVKSLNLGQYRYLHFATHGILGGEVPGIGEPALVLGDEPGEDGFLTASEVGKLKLGAEMTVLSACNTGSGEYVSGEGVMGMSRAFLAAGSRSVVVSLWPVASKQTERLMVEFYRHMRGGKPAAEAMRAAKLDMIEQARKTGGPESHPFFWAPFILLGG
jgi:CHAT domain-containing protein